MDLLDLNNDILTMIGEQVIKQRAYEDFCFTLDCEEQGRDPPCVQAQEEEREYWDKLADGSWGTCRRCDYLDCVCGRWKLIRDGETDDDDY